MRPPALQRALRTTVAVLALLLVSAAATAAGRYDTLIRNGLIVDGSGEAPYPADLAIRGDRIATIGDLEDAAAARVIDATGKAVSPGFINMMAWSVIDLIRDGRGMSDLTQGITLEVFGATTPRAYVLGMDDVQPTPAQLMAMQDFVRDAMREDSEEWENMLTGAGPRASS
ncbi:hypothetical protein [Pseudohaliea sp.]|uniref:hypothetical protein n=1 Tax=Pseudohaliea sp. TaxID=2740289 RepID=UPI0032F035C4